MDAGYDVPRLVLLLKDLPVQVLGRMRSDRVLCRTVPPRMTGARGRPPLHTVESSCSVTPTTWNAPDRHQGHPEGGPRRTGVHPSRAEAPALS
ncbi:transposase [Streptomyces sp. NPDC056708]|uniref:transposase n=1 Tax=unclassified Streptomyces TaxID=2593676 RepID=UPI003677FB50